MDDIFKPRQEPARSIYQAFQLEAGKRRGRSIEEWIAAEEDAVLGEGVIQAVSHGLKPPTLEDVVQARRYAIGSIDYGAKWAYCLVATMRRAQK